MSTISVLGWKFLSPIPAEPLTFELPAIGEADNGISGGGPAEREVLPAGLCLEMTHEWRCCRWSPAAPGNLLL